MRNKERARTLGEVFTPQYLVERVLGHIPKRVISDPKKTVLDNSCGNGQFLVEVMQLRRIAGASHRAALLGIYGIDIDDLNIRQTRERLLSGSKNKALIKIVEHNIVCTDALDPMHSGWNAVGGYMWGEQPNLFSRKYK